MKQATQRTQLQKTKQGGENMQNQQLQITQTCQPNERDSLYLYLQENGLSDLTVCVFPADPTDLNSRSSLIFPYLKSERSFLRLTYPCLEIVGKELTAIYLFTYKKKLVYDKDTKRVLQRFVKNGNMESKDICVIMPYQGRYYPFIIEGLKTKLNAIKSFLNERRQRGIMHPVIRVKHIMAKNMQGMDYPSIVIEILGEHTLTEQEQKLYNVLRGHFQWRMGLQPFSPLYPPSELKQEEATEEDMGMNDDGGDDLIADF
ncbi:MAG: hypothetical protein QXT86_14385 [Archaeoglobaceae archaeon]